MWIVSFGDIHMSVQTIGRYQPEVCLTGHIHESAAVDHIGRTIVVNAGAFRNGGYIVVERAPERLTAQLKYLT